MTNELLARIQDIERRLKIIEERLSDLNDLQLLNKLDIINLNSKFEKLKLGLGLPEMPEVKAKKPKKAKKCGECGALLPIRAKYCSKCGAKL